MRSSLSRSCSLFVLLALSACGAPTSTSDAHVDTDAATLPDAGMPGADANVDAALAAGFSLRYDLTAEFPEGGTFDPEGGAFFVGSLGDGSVYRIDAATSVEEVYFDETAPGTWWTLGMDVDVARRRLWVCAMDDQRATTTDDPPYDGYVWAFDLDTGARIASHPLADAFPNATCTDVAVASDGSVYVTDRESPNVYHLTEAGPATLFAADPRLGSSVIGLNALVVLPDQSALLAVLYLPSRLVRIDLADATVTDVAITGEFVDRAPALSGADGMTLSGSDLLVAFTSQVVRLSPTMTDWSAASATTTEVPAGLTDVVETPAGPYLLNGQAVRFALGGMTDPFALVHVDLAP